MATNTHYAQPADIFRHILDTLIALERDVTLAVLYSTDYTTLPDTCDLFLEGCIGVAKNHEAAPEHIDLWQDPDRGFISAIRRANSQGLPVLLKTARDPMPPFLTDGVDWRGYGEPARTLIVVPLIASAKNVGFLIMGTNPRQEYDEDYQEFVQELGRLSSTLIGSGISLEEARAREAKLFNQLSEREKFIHRVADVGQYRPTLKGVSYGCPKYVFTNFTLVPVGLFNLSPEGSVTWANSKYYEILGLPGAEEGKQFTLKINYSFDI